MTAAHLHRPPLRLTKPTVPESDILRGCLQLLAVHPAVSWAARYNSGASLIEGRDGIKRYVKFNTMPGQSDILGMLKNGRLIAIECKRKGEKATADQQSFLDLVNKHGGLGLVAFSADDVARALSLPKLPTCTESQTDAA
jgi:hypothetical protein